MDNTNEIVSRKSYSDAIAIIQAFKLQQDTPKPLDEPINYIKLKNATIKYIDLLKKGKIGNDDFKEEIFATAMEAVYGSDVWDWVRTNIKGDSNLKEAHMKKYLGK